MKLDSFALAGVYGMFLSLLILTGNFTETFLVIFCREPKYTLGNFGQVWANWHAIGCAYVGLTNLWVAFKAESLQSAAKQLVAFNSAFIYGTWSLQNTYYCIFRTDLFTPWMWLNAGGCAVAALLSLKDGLAEKSAEGHGKAYRPLS